MTKSSRSGKQAQILLFRRRPCSAATVRLTEAAGAAAAGNVTGTGDDDAVEIAGGPDGTTGTNGSGDTLADDPAAGHDHGAPGGAAAADGVDHPGAVKVAAAASTAFRCGAARLRCFGPRLAAPCRAFNRSRCITRTGQRLLVVADAAAGAALRESAADADRDNK